VLDILYSKSEHLDMTETKNTPQEITGKIFLPYYVTECKYTVYRRRNFVYMSLPDAVSLDMFHAYAFVDKSNHPGTFPPKLPAEDLFKIDPWSRCNIIRFEQPLPKEFWPNEMIIIEGETKVTLSGLKSTLYINTKGEIVIWMKIDDGNGDGYSNRDLYDIDSFSVEFKVDDNASKQLTTLEQYMCKTDKLIKSLTERVSLLEDKLKKAGVLDDEA